MTAPPVSADSTSTHAEGTGEEPRPPRSPLASTTPPPISLASVRLAAAKPDGHLPVALLQAMRTQLLAQGRGDAAAELESLFDLETGLARR